MIPKEFNGICTILRAVTVRRANFNSPINQSDIENYLTEALWKIFDRDRSAAAARLGVEEVNLKIANARVLAVKIDGKKIVNPEGFAGRTLEVSMAVTFRGSKREDSYGIEAGCLIAHCLSEKSISEVVYAETEGNLTKVFYSNKSKSSCVGEFNWGRANVIARITDDFGGNQASSGAIFDRFMQGEVSPAVSKRLGSIITRVFADLIEKVRARSKIPASGSIFLKTFFPTGMFEKRKFLFKGKRVKIVGVAESETARSRALFGNKAYEGLNRIINQRISWISPTFEK